MAIHPVVKSLLDEIDAFRIKNGMSVTAFGQKSLNDPGFIAGLRKRGRVPSIATAEHVRSFMRTYKGGRLAAALVAAGEPAIDAAAFYSAHPPLDVRGHAAVQARFMQPHQGDNGNGANHDSNSFKHWGNS